MKYFTKEMWASWQRDENGSRRERFDAVWSEYMAQLVALKDRLDEDAYRFFSEADVHDGELMEFAILDGSRPAPAGEPSRPWQSTLDYPVAASLKALEAGDEFAWSLHYTGIKRLVVDYPSDTPLFYTEGEGFSDWGYHELTALDDEFLQHEILFSTGATILVAFRSVTVDRRPARGG